MEKKKQSGLGKFVEATLPKRIDVEQAATNALNYFNKLYAGKGFTNIQLEEVELSDDDKYWFITLSYQPTVLDPIIKGPKAYKIFQIDAYTGNVKAMKIRSVE